MKHLNQPKRVKSGAWLLAWAILAMGGGQALAFSVHGPNPAWQTHQLGYDQYGAYPFAGTGPMNIGEEYRWNVPVVYFAFTADFFKYFGARGVTEVEKAVQMVNNLAPASQLNPDDFPMTSQRVNARASAVGLVDLRSQVLSELINYLGASDPTIWVYCLRNRWTDNTSTNYYIIKRNFDPITHEPTSFINGLLYTYTTITDNDGTARSILTPTPVSPFVFEQYQRAPVTSSLLLLPGSYWTGFTREDIAALNYIYRPQNTHVENVPTGATLGGSGGGLTAPGAAGGSGNQFNLANQVGGSGPWGLAPGISLTNLVTVTNTLTATNVAAAGTLIDAGVRGGVDKVLFQRVTFDDLLGSTITGGSASYRDTVTVSGRTTSQTVSRTLTTPDLVFDAGDLQGGDNQQATPLLSHSTPSWDNNAAINGLNSGNNYGPGTIVPGNGFVITFSNLGPALYNLYAAGTSEALATQLIPLWGAFDGTTNEPVVFPNGSSIRDIEPFILGGRGLP